MAKSHAKDFYGEAPEYSYWNGCSQGGRQGLMLAQRFPELYDGIVAAAPAQSWTKLFGNMLWPQQVMNREGYVPSPCELDAITNATIALCDGYDGVIDGIVSNPKACRSDADPAQFVGKQVDCSAYGQDSLVITSQAANIYAAYLDGLKTAEGKQVYPGLEPGSDPTGSFTAKMLSILVTECSENGKCVGKPNNLGITWLKYMVAKDPELDMQNLTDEEFRNLVYSGTQHYASIIGTEGTDLTKFRNRGGKMITWHGLADNIIAPMASENYYNNVTAVMPDIADFYRFYEVPGLGHCSGGPTKPPGKLLEQLMQWVEKGTVPEESPVTAIASDGTVQNRIICPYPKTAKLTACKDASLQECWTCDADPETLPKGIKGASPSAGHTLREEL
ncbi:hypothetical protein NX059_001342 [Plenodomus lindquistii]|nr:hypothetical protein NX059_001342 [Plenodomus lindquistii]